MANAYGLSRKGLEGVAPAELERVIAKELELTFVETPSVQAMADIILLNVGDSELEMPEERIEAFTREELEAMVKVGLGLQVSEELSDIELRALIASDGEEEEEEEARAGVIDEADIDETSIIKIEKLTSCQRRFRDEGNFYKTERYAKLFTDTGSPYTRKAQRAAFLVLHSKVWVSDDAAYVGCAGQVARETFDKVVRTAVEEGTIVRHVNVLYPFALIVNRISAPGL